MSLRPKDAQVARISHWIAGRTVPGSPDGRRGPVYNPATGEQHSEVDLASAGEVDQGVRFDTRTKVLTSRGPDPAGSSVDLGFPRTR